MYSPISSLLTTPAIVSGPTTYFDPNMKDCENNELKHSKSGDLTTVSINVESPDINLSPSKVEL